MMEVNQFFNDGYGWICRPCDRDLAVESTADDPSMPRYFREGEAEGKGPKLASRALAKWTDKTRRFLVCPRCGIVEPVDIS